MAILGIARFLAGSTTGFAQQCGTLLTLNLPHDAVIRPQLVALQQNRGVQPLDVLHAAFAKIAGGDPSFAELVRGLFAPDRSPSLLISERVIEEYAETQETGVNLYGKRTPPRSGHLEHQFQEADGRAPKKPLRAGQNRTDR